MYNTNSELKSLIKKDYLFADFNDFSEITDEVKNENVVRMFTGGVRINQGMYRTSKETDEYIEKSLMRALP